MKNSFQHTITKFFEAYAKCDYNGMKEVMAEHVTWFFLGEHPLAGVKSGFEEVIAFFDTMVGIMATSSGTTKKLIVAENEKHLIECHHSKTDRRNGKNMEYYSTVLWTFENGKIVEGRHFFSNQLAVDQYFAAVAPRELEKTYDDI